MKFPYTNMTKAKILLFKKRKEEKRQKIKKEVRFDVACDFQKFMDPQHPPIPTELFSSCGSQAHRALNLVLI